MESPKRALLFVGSPRAKGSTSESLGTYLLEKLDKSGFDTQKIHVQTSMRSPSGQEEMLELVKASEVLILAFPLYVDSLPAALISTLELIAQQRRGTNMPNNQKLLAIVNNGFPESSQNSTAIAICKKFASETNIEWMGGLSLGGGGTISGTPIEKAGFMARNVKKSLELAAIDLAEGRPVSKQAVDLMAKPMIPKWLYTTIANRGWKKQAKALDTQDQLCNQPKLNPEKNL